MSVVVQHADPPPLFFGTECDFLKVDKDPLPFKRDNVQVPNNINTRIHFISENIKRRFQVHVHIFYSKL